VARNTGGVQQDTTRPTLSLTTVSDTQAIASGLTFSVSASDNLTLRLLRLTYTGGYVAGPVDTTFTGTVPSASFGRSITFPANSGAGGQVRIVGRAVDGAGNFTEDTLFIFLSNVQSLQVLLVQPAPGAVASNGKSLPVQVIAVHNAGIRKIGFQVAPAAAVSNPTGTDSVLFAIPLQDSVNLTDTVTVNATSGTFSVVGFAEDSAGRRGTTSPVTVTVQSAATDNTPPSVAHVVGKRVEVSDSVQVHATDPSGITWIGVRTATVGGTLLRFDTVNVGGALTDVSRSFGLNLAALVTTFPTDIVVQGYACDAATARNCAFSQVGAVPGAAAKVDTASVVAGVTRPLPRGGSIADAIFNKNDSTLYLTNPLLSRVEIFQVANTSFVAAGIPTAGPSPWGIALWPRDTAGNYGDTIVVANAGGTELSVIDVSPGVRRLAWRQDLPDFLVEQYKVVSLGNGRFTSEITVYDLSDRPQYLATVCRTAGTSACAADSVFALYSTTPTISSTSPFDGHATLRLEKLINSKDTTQLFGHLFWEIGTTSQGATSDTLRIEMRRGLPYNQTRVVLTACAGVNVNIATFGLGDTTFARNSGNFAHAFFGEGGNVSAQFARVMAYTTKAPLLHGAPTNRVCFTSPDTSSFGPIDAGDNDVDFGMSPGVDVSDFISNTGVKVTAVATNFNGGTNVVRADSVYYLDQGLRLKGTSVAPTGAPGMDMNYNHAFNAGDPGTPTFGGTGNPNDRLLFAARPDANIDVFDTFFYGVVGSIPIRDPIIGPLRVARDAAGNQLLFGITAKGLVMVRLSTIANPFPAPPRAGAR
jgi:hypothetical protein